jgi:hypothetical protein
MLDSLLFCGKHNGAPLIKIKDRYICAIEYLDDLIGNSKVTSQAFIQNLKDADGAGTIAIDFDSGYSLPLTCPCCGDSLVIADLKNFNKLLHDKYLVALSYCEKTKEKDEMILLFFGEDPEGEPLQISPFNIGVHLNSVRSIQPTKKLIK